MAGESDMNRMREEAARRAWEMQAKARFTQLSKMPAAEQKTPERPPVSEREKSQRTPAAEKLSAAPESRVEKEPAGLLENLFQDKERTIILALLILLSGEEGNHELLFALLFLLM